MEPLTYTKLLKIGTHVGFCGHSDATEDARIHVKLFTHIELKPDSFREVVCSKLRKVHVLEFEILLGFPSAEDVKLPWDFYILNG